MVTSGQMMSISNSCMRDWCYYVNCYLMLGHYTCIAIGIGLLIYTKMSVPQDVEPFLTHHSKEEFSSDSNGKFWASFFKLYWMLVTIIYLFVSFETGDWYITWIIWLIGSAVKHAIILFGGLNADECK